MELPSCFILDSVCRSHLSPIYHIRSNRVPLLHWPFSHSKGLGRTSVYAYTAPDTAVLKNPIFSGLKRRFGDDVEASKYVNQGREVKLKYLVY